MQKIFVILIASAMFLGTSIPAQAAGTTSATGLSGQTLSASIPNGALSANGTTKVTISGKGYSTKVGIYVTFCVIPELGKKPELCGPFDVTGTKNQSIWISNNPPFYGKLLVKKFGKGGTFKVTMPINSSIDEFDCTKVKCAIVTRADHTKPDYRKADVIIPVTFK